jgi:predicted nucleic acid-binding protein
MPVVDASVLVTVFSRAQHASWAEAQLAGEDSRDALWAPHLIDAEVGHSLRRRAAAHGLPDDHAAAALRELVALRLRRVVHTGLVERAWSLRHNLSFYDGLYVALAEQLGVPLLTLDVRLAKAVPAVARVEVLTAPS